MGNEVKKPRIRFEGFTDAWEQRKFNDVFDFMQNNALSRAELNCDRGEVLNVHYGDILVKYGEVLNVERDELTCLLDSTLVNKYQSSLLQNGDVIIADAAEDETVGKCSEIAGLTTEKVLSGLHTIPCRPKMNFAEGYLGYYMNSRAYHNQLLPLIQGTKISSISKSAIQDTEIMFPKSENEQVQIGTYFRGLDYLITLHQRKYDKLQKIKKSMLQKMFPQNGSLFPEIRFEGFTDAWEQRKFGELADYKKGPFGSAITKDMFVEKSETSVKVYEQQNAINKDWTLERYFLPQNYVFNNLKSFEVHGGDVIVSCAGTIGEIYELPENAESGVINQALMRVRVNESIIQKQMFILLFSNMIERFTQSHSNGSAIKNIPPFSDLKPMEVLVPKRDEQILLADYFEQLDNLITLHQRKLDKLKNIKKSMLEKMFV